MSSSPDPAPAPQIDGYEYRRVLGVGGFSTVYLYEQLRPRREVAIKVLTSAALTPEGRRRFEVESDLMAALSAHPYIVTIHDAEITTDGSPYLVMEYYPGANLGLRARTELIGLAEVLQAGIHIASAVESAHRTGIVHRDIKPANVLTSRYNRPGLTDFGISTSASTGEHDEVAMSIPWSPPEAFDPSVTLDARADIYSLGAFIYSLLTGRSPFEILSGDNAADAISERIVHSEPVPIGRGDVPAGMERLLMQALSKSPQLRPSSALAMAQALQAVELDLSLPPTQIDVIEEMEALGSSPSGDHAVDPTRLRVVTLATIALASDGSPAETIADQTRIYEPEPAASTVRIQTRARRKPFVLLGALGGLLLLLLAGTAIVRSSGSDAEVTPAVTQVTTPAPTPSLTTSPTPSASVSIQPAPNANGPGNSQNGKGPKGKPAKKPKLR